MLSVIPASKTFLETKKSSLQFRHRKWDFGNDLGEPSPVNERRHKRGKPADVKKKKTVVSKEELYEGACMETPAGKTIKITSEDEEMDAVTGNWDPGRCEIEARVGRQQIQQSIPTFWFHASKKLLIT